MAILKRSRRRYIFRLQEDNPSTDPLLAQGEAVLIYVDPNLLLYNQL